MGFELVIIDDGSPGNSKEIVASYLLDERNVTSIRVTDVFSSPKKENNRRRK